MRVLRLVVHGRTREPVLLLGEADPGEGGGRCVPVFLRRAQADVIALGRRSGTDPLLPQDVVQGTDHPRSPLRGHPQNDEDQSRARLGLDAVLHAPEDSLQAARGSHADQRADGVPQHIGP